MKECLSLGLGRYVAASPDELDRWLSRECETIKKHLHIASDKEVVLADPKRAWKELYAPIVEGTKPDCS